MNEEIIKAIEAIIKRGNDVEIRRKGDGYIVLEVKKTIRKNACCLALFLFFRQNPQSSAVFDNAVAPEGMGPKKRRLKPWHLPGRC